MLTKADKDKIVSLHEEGFSIAKIASTTGHSPTTVWRIVKVHCGGPAEQGEPGAAVARINCRSPVLTQLLLQSSYVKLLKHTPTRIPHADAHRLNVLGERIDQLMGRVQQDVTCDELVRLRKGVTQIGEELFRIAVLARERNS